MSLQDQLKTPKKFKLSLRTGLLIVLLVAFMTFLGQVLISATAYYRYLSIREVADAENDYKQTILDIRITKLERARQAEMGLLEQVVEEQAEQGEDLPVSIDDVSPFTVDQVMGAVVEIICLDNDNKDVFYTGSGSIIDASGLVLTNQHVLMSGNGSMIRYCGIGFTTDIEQPPQIEFIAETTALGGDDLDLAILQVVEHLDGNDLPEAFPVMDLNGSRDASKALRLGDQVFIAGYPGIGAETFTFTQGVVSGRVGKKLIKTSALIDSGTSGGAAFDQRGRYIGTPTAAAAGDIGGSLGYLIAADIVDDFLGEFYAGNLNDSVSFGN